MSFLPAPPCRRPIAGFIAGCLVMAMAACSGGGAPEPEAPVGRASGRMTTGDTASPPADAGTQAQTRKRNEQQAPDRREPAPRIFSLGGDPTTPSAPVPETDDDEAGTDFIMLFDPATGGDAEDMERALFEALEKMVEGGDVEIEFATQGTMVWIGSLDRGQRVVIDRDRADRGKLSGDLLPGLPVTLSIQSDGVEVEIVKLPTYESGWQHIVFQSPYATKGDVRVEFHWELSLN